MPVPPSEVPSSDTQEATSSGTPDSYEELAPVIPDPPAANDDSNTHGFEHVSTEEIVAMEVDMLWKLVDRYDSVEQAIVDDQPRVITACLRVILRSMHNNSDLMPREDQVRVIRRLIYGSGDTLFIAATGFGKSLIFIAFSILTRKATVQIVPLTKLGEQQYEDIKQLKGTRPIFVQDESDRERDEFFKKLVSDQYTHILTSPEIAISDGFQAAIQRPEFTSEIGLVVIDECHLIEQWKDFRIEYPKLNQLRLLLRDEVLWFGCSATITPAKQSWILENGGFRAIGNEPYETEVIRTSIDRNDIFWEVQPIPYGMLSCWESVSWILDNAVTDGKATPHRIPKIVFYIDDVNDILDAVETISSLLLGMNANIREGPQYADDDKRTAYTVTETIRPYFARAAKYDKDRSFNEFKEIGSKTRIMFATTSLGMGVNIPDIEYVICWRFPIGFNMADTYQKAGRGGRGPGRTSTVILYLEYWAFKTLGQDPAEAKKERERQAQERRAQEQRDKADCFRAMHPSSSKESQSSPTQPSPLSVSISHENISDAESDKSTSTIKEREPNAIKIRTLTAAELAKKATLGREWLEVINGPCIRDPILREMGQKEKSVSEIDCCSRCNPERATHPLRPLKVVRDNVRGQPVKDTRAALALDSITKWVTDEIKQECGDDDTTGPIPIDMFMAEDCRRQLANLYNSKNVFNMVLLALKSSIIMPCAECQNDTNLVFLVEKKDIPKIITKRIPSLNSWYYWNKPQYRIKLKNFLAEQEEPINVLYQELQEQKQANSRRRKRTLQISNTSSADNNSDIYLKAATIRAAKRKHAAAQEAQAATLASSSRPAAPDSPSQSLNEAANIPRIEISTQEEANETIETSTPFTPDSFEDIDDADLLTHYLESLPQSSDHAPASPVSPCEKPRQREYSVNMKLPQRLSPQSPELSKSQKRQNLTPKSSQPKRRALAERDPNTPMPRRAVKKQLTFVAESRSGRKRKPSQNASSVYNI